MNLFNDRRHFELAPVNLPLILKTTIANTNLTYRSTEHNKVELSLQIDKGDAIKTTAYISVKSMAIPTIHTYHAI